MAIIDNWDTIVYPGHEAQGRAGVVESTSGEEKRQQASFREPELYRGDALGESVLPWYATNKSDPLDQWYTNRNVAKYCLEVFGRVALEQGYNLATHIFVEPSAGEGCFTDILPEPKICIDIEPRHPKVVKTDFLKWEPMMKDTAYAVIGNPPFGVRGSIALAFVNRAAKFANLVGFILPMTFESLGKGGARTRVKGLYLAHSEELPRDAFHDKWGKTRSVNTVFQVWTRSASRASKPKTCDSYVEIRTVCTVPNRRCGTHRMHEYDWFVASTFYASKPPEVVKSFDEVAYGSGYGIIIRKNRREISRVLKEADWLKNSSQATNYCRHVRMQHIRQVIIDGGFCD